MPVMTSCLEINVGSGSDSEELMEKVQVLDAKIEKLESAKPAQSDFISLIQSWERLKNLKREYGSSNFLEEKTNKLVENAKTLATNYISQQEKQLVEFAEKAIRENDISSFRAIVWDLQGLHQGTSIIAYDYKWIDWDSRPWHIYSLIMGLEDKFAERNNISPFTVSEWRRDDGRDMNFH